MSLIVAGCDNPPSQATVAHAHQVDYQLDWSWDGVEREASGSAWDVVNDLGYRVHVTRGYVVSYSMELVECPKSSDPAPLAGLGSALWSIVEPSAYAGHSSGTPNPAAVRAMQVESLTAPAAREAGAVRLDPQVYCQLHYLVARAAREASGLPPELDMVDTSLHVEGTFRAVDGAADVPFTVHTAAAYGAMFDHAINESKALRVDTGASATRVVVRRRLARMFDGVDFARMKPTVVATQILNSLIDHVEVEVHAANDPS